MTHGMMPMAAESALPLAGAARESRLPFTSILVGLFIVGATTVASLPGWNQVVKAMGVVLAAGYLIQTLRLGLYPTAEMVLYLSWLAWSLMGVFVARSGVLFWEEWMTCLQVWVLLVIIAGFTSSRRALTFNMLMFILGAVITGSYSYVTGEFARAETYGERVSGLAVNANGFGALMLLATVDFAHLWMLPTRSRPLKYPLLALGMTAAAAATLLTGSRKAVLGIGVFYALWGFFCYRHLLWRRAGVAAGFLTAVVVGGLLLHFVAQGGNIVERFQSSWQGFVEGRAVKGGGLERLDLYREAWDVFLKHPVLGVGLNNFRLYSARLAPVHSEYGEVLTGTGLVGALIYFPIYIALWVRAGRIRKYVTDPQARQVAGLIRAMLITMAFVSLGLQNYSSKTAWIVLGSFIGYTSAVWREWRLAHGGGGFDLPAAGSLPRAPDPAATPAP